VSVVAGLDVGSTYTKAVLLRNGDDIVGRAMHKTGFRLEEVSREAYRQALDEAGLHEGEVDYVVATGYGRAQVSFRDVQVTDLTAQARGASFFFPGTRTVLDVGGQTMKASLLNEQGKVKSFRLNDKCAAGTGAFLEKTARYLGFGTAEIGNLAATSKTPVFVSGVCAVFAESEVINHVSNGAAPSDIMQGAIVSLVDRSVQLMRRVRMEPEYTLVGGILRFESMVRAVEEKMKQTVNVPEGEWTQFSGAVGAAVLGTRRLKHLSKEGHREHQTTGGRS
jgi:predicted CoA-substrate-specific enzyme activase